MRIICFVMISGDSLNKNPSVFARACRVYPALLLNPPSSRLRRSWFSTTRSERTFHRRLRRQIGGLRPVSFVCAVFARVLLKPLCVPPKPLHKKLDSARPLARPLLCSHVRAWKTPLYNVPFLSFNSPIRNDRASFLPRPGSGFAELAQAVVATTGRRDVRRGGKNSRYK